MDSEKTKNKKDKKKQKKNIYNNKTFRQSW